MILVLGADGYLGFPLCMCLADRGYEVVGVDRFLRRKCVAEVGSHSATPILPMVQRLKAFEEIFEKKIWFEYGDIRDYDFVLHVMEQYRPEVVVHLGELASAPFSMIDAKHAALTQTNNIVGTLNVLHAIHEVVPDCHLVKLGSMGEYGAPNIDVAEGFFEVEYRGRKDTLPFPRHALSDWYHWSKVYDSGNVMMACEIWDLRSTDVMQGVVYGTRSDQMVKDELLTRFDFDAVFGTVINRFCAQAVLEYDLTVYGKGRQQRPFIALRDSLKCFMLTIDNPPEKGEYRVFNQFDEAYSVEEVASKVVKAARKLGLSTRIDHIENPRVEDEEVKYYNPIHEKLHSLGFEATHDLSTELDIILADLLRYRERIVEKQDQIMPKVSWRERSGKEDRLLMSWTRAR